ncbi:MAG TPA: hypothetical protein VEI57_02170 [Nitrospirota bacterium]|nr:hypothetical protein [Nitrospirota bacterium]
MSRLFTQRGGINFKVLFWLLVLFIVAHIGIKLVPMYLNAERMKDEMAVKARFAHTLKDDDITMDLAKKAKELDIPLGQEDFVLVRDDDNHHMNITAKWDMTVHFFFDVYPPYTTRVYHFQPVIQENYSR